MRIGIDWRPAEITNHKTRTGIGQYTYHLVANVLAQWSGHNFILFGNDSLEEGISAHPHVAFRRFPAKKLPFFSSHVLQARFLEKQNLDVYHQTGGVLPYTYRGQSLFTVHDLAIFFHPEWFPDSQWWSRRVFFPASVKKASRLVAVSQSTKDDVIERFQLSPKKIRVIYHGPAIDPNVEARPPQAAIKKPYLLYIGTIEPRKNLSALLDAFETLKKQTEFQSLRLVLAGQAGWKCADILQRLKTSPHAAGIHWLGEISEMNKKWLLANAVVFIYPSLYEGFGLPILEAMSQGLPVVCSDTKALREIAGGAARHVRPESQALFHGLREILLNEQERLERARLGRERASHFTWRKTAHETIRLYEHLFSLSRS